MRLKRRWDASQDERWIDVNEERAEDNPLVSSTSTFT
jgi:hypothetical protein